MKEMFPDTNGRVCYYCFQPWTYIAHRNDGKDRENTNFSIDRLDNTKTYTEENIVFCCGKCNDSKHSVTFEMVDRIQEIRKEVGENSEKSRQEIEKKLTDINKGIYAYQENSKEDMQKQFASSNKVIKEVTSELEKIKGTNEQVLGFANQMKTLEKILSNQKQRGIAKRKIYFAIFLCMDLA